MTGTRSAAVVLAGGQGRRFGNPALPKQFEALGGRPILAHVVDRYASHRYINQLVVVCHPEWIDLAGSVCEDIAPGRIRIVPGSQSRNGSALNGVKALQGPEERVLIHDAARPLVTPSLISRVTEALANYRAVAPVIPTIDAVGRVEGDRIVGFEDRSKLCRIQTPQGFDLPYLRTHLSSIPDDELGNFPTIFEALLASDPSLEIGTVDGDEGNLKVTVPVDRTYASVLLGRAAEHPQRRNR